MEKTYNVKTAVVRGLLYVLLIGLALTYLYPLFFMVVNSLKSQTEYMVDPFGMSGSQYGNYITIFSRFRIQTYLGNTLFVTVMKLILALPLSICASYAFSKLRFSGSRLMYPIVMIAMFIPFQVIMIPVYVMLSRMRLINTFTGLILVGVGSMLPGMILLMTGNFRGIPTEMIEAAKIDGCGYFRMVFSVVAPMGMPAISICTIMNFIGSWNDLLAPMVILKGVNKQLIMPALNNLVSQFSKDIPFQLTGMVFASVPAIAIYLVLQKQIIMGISSGSVK